ncbi:bifunctional lysylphosphatidylglycerol flippase/synthetase MprF [Frigoribacterium sp. CFBP 8766]|uniref:bifunctional lysylphosphatidylglycerol flippase/synthetase MprF n=1 Tax=Frigoribacterium sp. CFBP 8766 TaxID=2775273 RepID=UPI0035304BA5
MSEHTTTSDPATPSSSAVETASSASSSGIGAGTAAAGAAAARLRRWHPLALLALLAGASWVVVRGLSDGHPHWAGSVVGVALTVAGVAWAEERLGTRRAAAIAVLGSVLAVVPAVFLLRLGEAVGEQFSEFAETDRVWSPTVTLVVVVAAASRGLAPARRQGVRAALVAVVLAALLFGGHGGDLARAAALLAGLALGRRLVPLSTRSAWHDETARSARTIAATTLGTVALGWAIAAVGRDAVGVLSPIADLLDPAATIAAIGVLVLAVALLLRGRRLGLVLAVAALLLMTGLLAWYFTVIPLADDWFTWTGVPSGELEWQVALLLVWLVPAASIVVLLTRRQAFGRRATGNGASDDRQRVLDQLARSDAGSLGYMGTWAGNSHWFAADEATADEEAAVPSGAHRASCDGSVAYRAAHGVALTVSDPVSSETEAAETIRRFARWCSTQALVPAFYSVHERHLGTFAELGWNVTPVAEEAVLDLAGFTTAGKKRQDLRTAVNRASRDGVEAVWGTWASLPDRLRAQVESLSDDWVDAKALPEMGFTLGGLAELDDPDVRVLLAVDGAGRLHGVTSWLPVRRGGVLVGRTLDVMRRGADPMPGVVEFLITTAAQTFRTEGLETLSLSGTPLAPARPDLPTTLVSRGVARLMALTGRVLEPSYGFSSLARFKAKFDPRHETLWLACPSAADLAPISRALAAAYVPGLQARQVVAALGAARGRKETDR